MILEEVAIRARPGTDVPLNNGAQKRNLYHERRQSVCAPVRSLPGFQAPAEIGNTARNVVVGEPCHGPTGIVSHHPLRTVSFRRSSREV